MPKRIRNPVPRRFGLFIAFRALRLVEITVDAVEAGIINLIAPNLRSRTTWLNKMLKIALVPKESAVFRGIILSRGHIQTSNRHGPRRIARGIII
jgi:hypothetical protein